MTPIRVLHLITDTDSGGANRRRHPSLQVGRS
jgi:hypothetical protein